MAKRIAVANFKGGVGKSTCAMLLADSLAHAGKRVLVLDCDAQANLSAMLCGAVAIKPVYEARRTVAALIEDYLDGMQPLNLRNYISPKKSDVDISGVGPVDLIAGHPGLRTLELRLFRKFADNSGDIQLNALELAKNLDDLLKPLEQEYSYVILDCAPGLSFLADAALRLAPDVLSPVIPDYVSRLALENFAKEILPGVSPLRGERKHSVLISKFQANIVEMSAEKELIAGNTRFQTLNFSVPQSTDLLKASRYSVKKRPYNRHTTNNGKYSQTLRAIGKGLVDHYEARKIQ